MKKTLYNILLLLLIGNVTFSQTSISVTPRQDTILIGDHLVVDVVLQTDNADDIQSIDFTEWKSLTNLVYNIDTINLEKETRLSIIDENEWGISESYFSSPAGTMEGWFTNDNTVSKPITVSIYDYGIWSLPSPIINTKSGKRYPIIEAGEILVMPANLGMPQDSVALMPIKDIIEEGESWEDYKIWFYILGFILLAPLLIKLLWGRKKEEEIETIEEEIFIPAHEKAIAALTALKEKQLWQKGNVKEYQSELTIIIRRYLQDRFEVNALEMTTDEINRALRQKDFDTKHSGTLQRILTIADLVKFAKATPPVDINAQFMEEAEQFVNSTKKELSDLQQTELGSYTNHLEETKVNTVKKSKPKRILSTLNIWSEMLKGLLIPLIILMLSVNLIKNAFSDEISNRKIELQQLVDSGININGRLNETYEESTVKISKLKTKSYSFTYNFNVDSKNYKGNVRYLELPENLNISITYLESNPNINSAKPLKELENLVDDTSWLSVLIGIALFLLGLYLLYNFNSKYIKKKGS